MDISGLKRDAAFVRENFATVNGRVLTKRDCTFLIPFNYLSHKLATMGNQIYTAGVFAIVIGDRFASAVSCARVEISPNETKQIKILGEEYLEFRFPKGSVVLPSTNIIVDSDNIYEMNKYFYTFGRVPWFLSYNELGEIMRMQKEYGGLNFSPDNIPFEIVVSKICRDPNNKFVYWRHSPMKGNPVVVPFKSVLFNATNTTAKILGAYLSDGFTSALVNPSDSVEQVETLLRA
jgi:hypothetical protein